MKYTFISIWRLNYSSVPDCWDESRLLPSVVLYTDRGRGYRVVWFLVPCLCSGVLRLIASVQIPGHRCFSCPSSVQLELTECDVARFFLVLINKKIDWTLCLARGILCASVWQWSQKSLWGCSLLISLFLPGSDYTLELMQNDEYENTSPVCGDKLTCLLEPVKSLCKCNVQTTNDLLRSIFYGFIAAVFVVAW